MVQGQSDRGAGRADGSRCQIRQKGLLAGTPSEVLDVHRGPTDTSRVVFFSDVDWNLLLSISCTLRYVSTCWLEVLGFAGRKTDCSSVEMLSPRSK